jgi:DNA-binding transcriptional regulator YdaS (Cro superfamily)
MLHAVRLAGGPAKLAALLGVTTQAVCNWRDGKRRLPAEFCAPIEKATQGVVRRWDLRQDDWHLIWPELVDADGAPAVHHPALVCDEV